MNDANETYKLEQMGYCCTRTASTAFPFEYIPACILAWLGAAIFAMRGDILSSWAMGLIGLAAGAAAYVSRMFQPRFIAVSTRTKSILVIRKFGWVRTVEELDAVNFTEVFTYETINRFPKFVVALRHINGDIRRIAILRCAAGSSKTVNDTALLVDIRHCISRIQNISDRGHLGRHDLI